LLISLPSATDLGAFGGVISERIVPFTPRRHEVVGPQGTDDTGRASRELDGGGRDAVRGDLPIEVNAQTFSRLHVHAGGG
jgi:hypothetical protein